MSCPSLQDLSDFLDGKLSESELDAIANHLNECANCESTCEDLEGNSENQLDDWIRRSEESSHPKAPAASEVVRRAIKNASSEARGRQASFNEQEAEVRFLLNAIGTSFDENGLAPFGDFEIIDVLGIGGMGIVFRANDTKLNRQVALKVMKPAFLTNRSAKDRFIQEAKTAASLDHPNIIPIFQVFEQKDAPCIVMKLLEGESLHDRLLKKDLTQMQAVQIGRQIAAGLQAAHDRKLIHRDIKPQNIWLGSNDEVTILDFGLVRATESNAEITQSGVLIGTPAYMSPEQVKGEGIGPQSDLFSLGGVLYRVVTGAPPFSGSNLTSTLLAVTQDTPPSIRKTQKRIDRTLSKLIDKLLQKNIRDRFRTAAEVELELKKLQKRLATKSNQFTNLMATDTDDTQQESMESRIWYRNFVLTSIVLFGLFATILLLIKKSNSPSKDAPTSFEKDATRAVQRQKDIAEQLNLQLRFTNSIGMQFSLIPAGEFAMGLTEKEFLHTQRLLESIPDARNFEWEKPAHQVTLTQPYYIGIHEVTVDQFRQFVNDAEYTTEAEKDSLGGFGVVDGNLMVDRHPALNRLNPSFHQQGDHPVVLVTWNDANAFCAWLSQKESRTYRLPTEAEFEYAVRSGTRSVFHFGNDPSLLPDYANTHASGRFQTDAVGKRLPNPFGLYDVYGNVWEWCGDRWGTYRREDVVDPTGALSGTHRVTRGGSFLNDHVRSRSSGMRGSDKQTECYATLGFRIVRVDLTD